MGSRAREVGRRLNARNTRGEETGKKGLKPGNGRVGHASGFMSGKRTAAAPRGDELSGLNDWL